MLWMKLEQWADAVYAFARASGLQDSVMTLDELSSGDEARGTGGPACWVLTQTTACMWALSGIAH